MNSNISAQSGSSQLRRSTYTHVHEPGCAEQLLARYRGGWCTEEASCDTSHLCCLTTMLSATQLCGYSCLHPTRQFHASCETSYWQLPCRAFLSWQSRCRAAPGSAVVPSRPATLCLLLNCGVMHYVAACTV